MCHLLLKSKNIKPIITNNIPNIEYILGFSLSIYIENNNVNIGAEYTIVPTR